MILLMYLWGFESSKKDSIVERSISWIMRLYIIQLAFLALTQIAYVVHWINLYPTLQNALYTSGLILNNSHLLHVIEDYNP
jgi:hypothetical protein